MGCCQSRAEREQIARLSRETKFSEEEISLWHDGFLADCPTGRLTKTEFAIVFSQFFPAGDPAAFAR